MVFGTGAYDEKICGRVIYNSKIAYFIFLGYSTVSSVIPEAPKPLRNGSVLAGTIAECIDRIEI